SIKQVAGRCENEILSGNPFERDQLVASPRASGGCLLPGLAAVFTAKYALKTAIQRPGRIHGVAVRRDLAEAPSRESAVQRMYRRSAVVAFPKTRILRRNIENFGIRRIDRQRIDFECVHLLPGLTAIRGLQQPFSRPGVKNIRIRWILPDHVRAALAMRNAFKLHPGFPAIRAVVNAAARAGENPVWLGLIDVDGENIRIVDHSCVNRVPSLAAIAGPPS